MFLDEATRRMVIPFVEMGTQKREEALQGRESTQFGAWRICMLLRHNVANEFGTQRKEGRGNNEDSEELVSFPCLGDAGR